MVEIRQHAILTLKFCKVYFVLIIVLSMVLSIVICVRGELIARVLGVWRRLASQTLSDTTSPP